MRMGERKATDMRRIRKLHKKRKNESGFTLVEMIVVLVIIAILAAITIPALLKYIDKAKDKQVLIDTRAICMATQSAMAEAYATDAWKSYGNGAPLIGYKNGNEAQKKQYRDIVDLADVSTLQGSGSFGAYVGDDGIVSDIIYNNGNGKIGIYFRETDEYIIYDKTDFTSFDDWYDSDIKDRVKYMPYKPDEAVYADKKAVILATLGYKGK